MDLTTREQIEALLGAYRAAELAILGMLADAAGAAGTEAWFRGQHRQLERLIRRAERLLEAAHPTEGQIQEVLANGHAEGVTAATPPNTPPAAVPAPAVAATVAEVQGALESAGAMILRETRDIYRRIARQAAVEQITSGADNRRMLQRIIDEYANRGITGFRDRAGRRWSIDTYAEMTLRTAVNRAQNQGRIDGYQAHGVNLIKTSQHIGAHPWCIPWQNKVLALDGYAGSRTVMNNLTGHEVVVEVAGTLQEAIAAGYHHPNAILGGDQLIDTLGGAVGASKGTYRGPALTISTAQGNQVTVSPNHPVLTGRGWVTAQSVRKGDNLFSTLPGGGSPVRRVSGPHLDDMPTTVEEEFSAVKLVGTGVNCPTAGLHFDDDRQFLEGEVNVIVTDDCLLPVPDAHIVEETGEVRFLWPNVGSSSGAGGGALPAGAGTVGGSVGRPLPNGFPAVFETAAERRVGDSENVGEVLAAVPGPVEAQEVVDVHRFTFEGHAYDFQTSEGIYAVNGLIVHNCRHTDTAFVPWLEGEEDIQTGEEEYRAEQRQREIERHIRQWKRRKAGSFSERSNTLSEFKIRVWQEEQREHLKKYPWLTRRYDREKLWYQSTRKGGRN